MGIRINLNIKFAIIFIICIAVVLFTELQINSQNVAKLSEKEDQAVKLTSDWFQLINQLKIEKGITNHDFDVLKYCGLMGIEYSTITTTLGSLEAKQTAINPFFSALILEYFESQNINQNSIVGLNISGSFPSLAIAALAATQTIGAKTILISSLGSSMYGANDPVCTWLDMEKYLNKYGNLETSSILVSPGGGNDIGLGLIDGGIEDIHLAADRNGVVLFMAKSLEESITKRLEIFKENKIDVLINIGGNHPAMGNCIHSLSIPNGMSLKLNSCNDDGRSLLFRISEMGIPIIHLLNLKELALRNGLQLTPSVAFGINRIDNSEMSKSKLVIASILIGLTLFIYGIWKL